MRAPAILAAALCAIAGCARTPPPPRPADVAVIRSYTCATDVADPQPAWNPAVDQLVLRADHGFILHREGRDRREVFLADDRRQTGLPAWISPGQFVFGPPVNVLRLADGRWVPATDGITIVTVTDNGYRCLVARATLGAVGFHPRPWGADAVVATVDDRLVALDPRGTSHEIGRGFLAEPQPGGEGLCWRSTPYPWDDAWTGIQPPGSLFIRWRSGEVTEVPRALQPRWTRDGRVVATVLRGDPPNPARWWDAGTAVVVVSRDGTVRTLAEQVRDPDPHPRHPLVAVSERGGGVRLLDLDGGAPSALIASLGREPRWNADGQRLALVEPPAKEGERGSVVRVLALRIDRPKAP